MDAIAEHWRRVPGTSVTAGTELVIEARGLRKRRLTDAALRFAGPIRSPKVSRRQRSCAFKVVHGGKSQRVGVSGTPYRGSTTLVWQLNPRGVMNNR